MTMPSRLPSRLLSLFAIAAASVAVRGQEPPAPPPPFLPELATAVAAAQEALHTPVVLVVARGSRIVHQQLPAAADPAAPVPLGDASALLTAVVVLTQVEQGLLDLDVPVHRYLAEFARPDKEGITLRQCLAGTAGLPDLRDEMRRSRDTAALLEHIAGTGLRAEPATEFRPGPLGPIVAAAACERRAGRPFRALVEQWLAAPLDLRTLTFGDERAVASPEMAALLAAGDGARLSLPDAARFAGMLAAGGRVGARSVLSADAVQQILADQETTGRLRVANADFGGDVRHGLGVWLQRWDRNGRGERAAAVGGPGFALWVDADIGVGGAFFAEAKAAARLRALAPIQDRARELLAASGAGADEEIALRHGDRDRGYLLHVPPAAAVAARLGDRLPLVLVLHGGGGNGRQAAESTGFSAVADAHGFVVAYPHGTGVLPRRLLTWNSGNIPVYAQEHDIDDVGFLRAVVEDVRQRQPIDAGRVYATGMSNGGMMTHRLARQAGDLFAAVAPVAGAMNWQQGDVGGPLPVMIVHGDGDQHVLYEGGRPKRSTGRAGEREDASVQTAVEYYRQRNGLGGSSERVTVGTDGKPDPAGKVRIETWARTADGQPAAPVVVVTLQGGGHAWPGGERGRYRGADEPFPWPASEAIWQFFAQHRR